MPQRAALASRDVDAFLKASDYMYAHETEAGVGGDGDNDKLLCAICTRMLEDPVKSCLICVNRHFCRSCITDWIAARTPATCPTCRGPVGELREPHPDVIDAVDNALRISYRDHLRLWCPGVELATGSSSSAPPANQDVVVVHEDTACDGCEMNPLRGTRFKCLTCPDYDLCEACFASERAGWPTHKPPRHPDHPMVALATAGLIHKVVVANATHKNVTCDACESVVAGPRWTCTVCDNYDLCNRCQHLDPIIPHTADHPMVWRRRPD